MTRLKLTLCSVMRVSALEGIQDKEIAKLTPTGHRGERNGRFVWFFKYICRYQILNHCSIFAIVTSSPRFSRFSLVNEKTLGTRLIRLIVEIKSVNVPLVFQVLFYCDIAMSISEKLSYSKLQSVPCQKCVYYISWFIWWVERGKVWCVKTPGRTTGTCCGCNFWDGNWL